MVPIYLAAGQKWRDSADLYQHTPGLDLYRNPPGVAAAFAALTPLPEKVAGLAWRGGCLAVFLLGLWRFRRDAVPELSPDRAAWLFALAAPLALAPLNNGQVNLLLAGCGAERRRRVGPRPVVVGGRVVRGHGRGSRSTRWRSGCWWR